jgi:hypothetical protein
MIYHCGHKGCDICGARECDPRMRVRLTKYHDYLTCDVCVRLAVKFAYEVAATFGGSEIDPAKPCGNTKEVHDETQGR